MEDFLDSVNVVAGRPLRDCVSQGLSEVLIAKAVYKSLSSKQWESTHPNNLLDYRKSTTDLFQSGNIQTDGETSELKKCTNMLANLYTLT